MNAFWSVGVVGSLLWLNVDDPDPSATKEPVEVQADSLANPFPLERAGVPYTPASFGTGLPARLSREEAVETIYKVFEEQGILLEKNVPVEQDSVRITAEGYNEDQKLGFVWIDHYNYGPGMTVPYRNDQTADLNIDELEDRFISQLMVNYLQPNNYYLKTLRKKPTPHGTRFLKFIDEELPQLSADQQKTAFKHQFLVHYLKDLLFRNGDYLAPLRETVKQTLKNNDVSKMLRMKQVVQHYNRFNGNAYNEFSPTILKELLKGFDGNDSNWFQQVKFVDQLYYKIHKASRYKQQDYLEALKTALETDEPQRITLFAEADQILDHVQIGLAEAHRLEEAAEHCHYYIAPISQRDYRFAYRHPYREYEPTPKAEKLMKKIKKAKSDEKRKELRKQLEAMGKSAYVLKKPEVDPKTKSLKRLEEEVRAYIRWARSQQGY